MHLHYIRIFSIVRDGVVHVAVSEVKCVCGGGAAGAGRQRVDGLSDNVLVARTIIVADENDYIIDLVLHQNAVLETVCSVSGALTTHYYYSPDTQLSGYRVRTTHRPQRGRGWGQERGRSGGGAGGSSGGRSWGRVMSGRISSC